MNFEKSPVACANEKFRQLSRSDSNEVLLVDLEAMATTLSH